MCVCLDSIVILSLGCGLAIMPKRDWLIYGWTVKISNVYILCPQEKNTPTGVQLYCYNVELVRLCTTECTYSCRAVWQHKHNKQNTHFLHTKTFISNILLNKTAINANLVLYCFYIQTKTFSITLHIVWQQCHYPKCF